MTYNDTPSNPEKLPSQREQALIVDDDDSQAMLSRLLLERMGYRVTTCETASEALDLIRQDAHKFRFIATDYTMFPIDGMELARSILQINPAAIVILLTGYDHPTLLREAQEIGIRQVCAKPTSAEEFTEVLIQLGL